MAAEEGADGTTVGTTATVPIHGIAAGGTGVGRLPDGRAVFVHRTAPGDRARVELTTVKRRWARGRLVELDEAGPQRREAPCPFYDRCGGCTLEHLEYAAQLQAKTTLVTDALERIGGRSDLPEVEAHPSPREFRYRSRVSFTLLRLQGGRVVAGFHELERPGHILDVDGGCLLPEAPVARVWDAMRSGWGPSARRLPPGAKLRLTLRHLGDGQVTLLVEGGGGGGEPYALLKEVPGLRAIWHRPEGGEIPQLVAGHGDLEETWLGERYPARAGAFVQVNREAGEELHALALRELGAPRGRRFVDAYCGIGVYGRRMARHGGTAVGIEVDEGAVEMARSRPQGGFTILEGRVEDRLSEALPADVVILNPPRAGVADGVMETLAHARPARIVYVSCDPATLARDLDRLGDAYRVGRLQVFDLFPQTAHVETLVTLDTRR